MTAFTTTSPTIDGPLPRQITAVGGLVLDLVGTSGDRVLSQIPAAELYVGTFRGGQPSAYAGDPGTIGIQAGYTDQVLEALGGGLVDAAVRLSLFDGDNGPRDHDFRDNFLMVDGIMLGDLSDVATERTDAFGTATIGINPGTGFRNNALDTGFVRINDPAKLAALFSALQDGSLRFQIKSMNAPFDNTFDFTRGVAGGSLPFVQDKPPAIVSAVQVGSASEGGPARVRVQAVDREQPAATLQYLFDFDGDGTFEVAGPNAEAQAPFRADGRYPVRVRVVDRAGGMAESVATVTVANVAPSLAPPAAQTIAEGGSGPFALGTLGDVGAESAWRVAVDWGDGSPIESFDVAAVGALGARTHAYAVPGIYTVGVTADDGDDVTATQFVVTVANVAPIATAPADQSTPEGQAKRWDLGRFVDPGVVGPWTVLVDWGDGTPIQATTVAQPGAIPGREHRYAREGHYDVKVSVSDGIASHVAQFRAVVANVAPTLALPPRGGTSEGTTVAWSLGTFDDVGGEPAWDVAVDWGDGSPVERFRAERPGDLGRRPHRYDQDGTYALTVSVDDGTDRVSATSTVAVAAVAPRLVPAGPGVFGREGRPVSVPLGTLIDPGREGAWAITVDYGDGSPTESFSVATAGDLGMRLHVYEQNGIYPVRVTATASDGRDEATATARIGNQAPSLDRVAITETVEAGGKAVLELTWRDEGRGDAVTVTIDWDGERITAVLSKDRPVVRFERLMVGEPRDVDVIVTLSDADGGTTIWTGRFAVVTPTDQDAPIDEADADEAEAPAARGRRQAPAEASLAGLGPAIAMALMGATQTGVMSLSPPLPPAVATPPAPAPTNAAISAQTAVEVRTDRDEGRGPEPLPEAVRPASARTTATTAAIATPTATVAAPVVGTAFGTTVTVLLTIQQQQMTHSGRRDNAFAAARSRADAAAGGRGR